MKVTSIKKHILPCLTGLALAVALAGCTSTSSPTAQAPRVELSTTQAFSSLTASQAEYRKMLDSADAANRFSALVLLTRSSIVARDYQTAAGLIATMQQEAKSLQERDQSLIIESLLMLHQGKNKEARMILDKVNFAQLPRPVASFFYQLSSSVELSLYNDDHNAAHVMRASGDKITLLNYVNPETRKVVSQQIVKTLQNLSMTDLTEQQSKTEDYILRGFIEYAVLDSSESAKVKQQLFDDWLSKYPNHPLGENAQALLQGHTVDQEGNIAVTQITALKEGDRLAVLLPLTGRFAENVGEPARLGILAALQDRNAALRVTFYDTNRMSMESILAALDKNQTNFIIGPILKPEVDALISGGIKIPAIVFNQPASPIPNLFYYNLGPDYEGALAAARITADGHTRPVVISPESTRGVRAATGFNKVWLDKHSQKAIVCRFKENNSIDNDLITCPMATSDAIYIHATANEVIKAKGEFPRGVPVYLTDRTYMGLNHSSGETALQGLYLGDMPWLLTDSALKNDLMSTLPKADTQVQRIFASAYDSLNLAFNLNRLHQNSKDVLRGISGDLQIGAKGQIEMSPMWVKLGLDRQSHF